MAQISKIFVATPEREEAEIRRLQFYGWHAVFPKTEDKLKEHADASHH